MMMIDLRWMNLNREEIEYIQGVIEEAVANRRDVDVTLHFKTNDNGLPVGTLDWTQLEKPDFNTWRLN